MNQVPWYSSLEPGSFTQFSFFAAIIETIRSFRKRWWGRCGTVCTSISGYRTARSADLRSSLRFEFCFCTRARRIVSYPVNVVIRTCLLLRIVESKNRHGKRSLSSDQTPITVKQLKTNLCTIKCFSVWHYLFSILFRIFSRLRFISVCIERLTPIKGDDFPPQTKNWLRTNCR